MDKKNLTPYEAGRRAASAVIKRFKTFVYEGQTVSIIKPLMLPQPAVNGRLTPPKPLLDKDGEWVQIKFEDGPRAGCRIPASKSSLTENKPSV